MFVARFGQSLQQAMGIELHFNATFHPQMDGQSERVIQMVEDMLRAYMLDFKGSWSNHLPLVEFAYNNSYQNSIGRHHMKHYMKDPIDPRRVG